LTRFGGVGRYRIGTSKIVVGPFSEVSKVQMNGARQNATNPATKR
jgi:hypothetical protein